MYIVFTLYTLVMFSALIFLGGGAVLPSPQTVSSAPPHRRRQRLGLVHETIIYLVSILSTFWINVQPYSLIYENALENVIEHVPVPKFPENVLQNIG